MLLEIGESFWKTDLYRTIKKADMELEYRGQVLFRNYDELIKNDPEVRIVSRKRKLNGKLYYYVLEKKKL